MAIAENESVCKARISKHIQRIDENNATVPPAN